MCELGSQGGMDGRWHCSAAQVEILLFQHAEILLFTLSHFFSLSFCLFFCFSLLVVVRLRPSLCQHALLVVYEKTCKDVDKEGGTEGRRFLGCTCL